MPGVSIIAYLRTSTATFKYTATVKKANCYQQENANAQSFHYNLIYGAVHN